MKRAIELRIIMQVEVCALEGEDARFYLEENHCTTNHIDDLADAVEADHKKGLCNLCPFVGVTLLPEGFPLADAFDCDRPGEPSRRATS